MGEKRMEKNKVKETVDIQYFVKPIYNFKASEE